MEDMVHEIANVGPHFKEPGGRCLQGKKSSYKEGGDSGNREDDINDLINEMN
uniref:Uncharacterized protein n=1 Tax=Cucumis sativus TaxID=3659 RepID=A0A0A0LKE5_CUCSA